jgi:hypothetical protein
MNKILAGTALTFIATQARAAAENSVSFFTANVPTLDDVALVGLTLIVAAAGGFAARRRRK